MPIGLVFRNLPLKGRIFFFFRLPGTFLRTFSMYSSYFGRVRRHVRNWPDVFLVTRGIKSHALLEFSDGVKFDMTKKTHLNVASYCEFLDMPEKAKKALKVEKSGDKIKMKYGNTSLISKTEFATPLIMEFYGNSHGLIDVKDRVVVDIGAYVGDTAVYYLLSGKAKKIYGLEIDPRIYREAETLVRENKLDGKIVMLCTGIAEKGNLDSMKLSEARLRDIGSKSEGKLKTISLDALADALNIKDGALKIDVEGMEYGVFDGASSKTLRRFKTMHIEYHYGYLQLVKRLNAEGFKVTCTNPYFKFNLLSGAGITCQGDIVAVRK